MLHPFPSLLVATLTLLLIPVADRHAGLARYVALSLGMLYYQCCIGVTNDLVDAADDAVAKPWKALASGAIGRRAAVLLSVALGLIGLGLTAPLGVAAWLIGVAGLGCGLSYDLWLKRSPLSWLPWSIAFPLIPTWVWVASGSWSPFLLWVWPLGALFGLSLHLANQAPDAEGDAAQGIDSLVQRLGMRNAARLAVVLFVVGACIASAAVLTRSGTSAALMVAVAAIALLVRLPLVRTTEPSGDFPVLAVATAAIAVLFMLVV